MAAVELRGKSAGGGVWKHKATGPDGIPSHLLKITTEELAVTLQLIFQSSLSQGIVSDDWKKAHIVPAFKKGDKKIKPSKLPTNLPHLCV